MDYDAKSIRHSESDPPDAEKFWQDNIESLGASEREQVETPLPSINAN